MRIIFKYFFVILVNLLLLILLVAFCGYQYFSAGLPDVNELKTIQLQKPMEVLSIDGELIATFGEHRRIPLKYEQIPEKLTQAVIATEDSRFFEHHGVDPVGITRALYIAVTSGAVSQGGSTITQQLAKNFFLTPEKKITRKIKEMILALRIEKVLTKQEILELYLNKIYLGSRSYGVGAAAYTYFGKQIGELTLGEIATLAGLPKAPTAFNPINAHDKAVARRNWVLGRMLGQEFITEQEYNQAVNEPLDASYHDPKIDFSAPYVAEMVRQYMYDKFGENAYTDGYRVYTTVSKKLQLAATDALQNNLFNFDVRHGYRGPVKVLWKGNETAWQTPAILDELKKYPPIEMLYPAVVTNAAKREVLTLNEDVQVLSARSVAWGRSKFRNGHLIWIRKNNKDWILSQIPDVNSAIVSIDSYDGAIKALVGGFNFNLSKFNRVTQSIRQTGSNIKPFIYAAGLNKGLTLATVLNDAPITIRVGKKNWSPKNSPNIYAGPIRIRVGLGLSKNAIMVRVMRIIGVDYAADFLHRFGFPESNISRTESLVLGSASFSPLQVARGYSVFTNSGFLVSPFFIDKIKNSDDKILFIATPLVACADCDLPVPDNDDLIDQNPKISLLEKVNDDEMLSEDAPDIDTPDEDKLTADASLNLPQIESNEPKPIVDGPEPHYAPHTISNELAFLMRSALTSNIWGEAGGSWRPTGARARVLNRRDIGGKTGTTNKSKDGWFSGFGANLATSVWIGYDDHRRSLRGEGGSGAALPAWIAFMKVALEGVEVKKDVPPQGIVTLTVEGRKEYFIKGKDQIIVPMEVMPNKEVGTSIKSNGRQFELF